MVGDTEAVGFVAKLLHYAQRVGILVDIQRHAVAREIDLFQTFCDADERHFAAKAYFIECLQRGAQLPFAAVDDDQLRKVVGRFLHQACIPPRQHFFH